MLLQRLHMHGLNEQDGLLGMCRMPQKRRMQRVPGLQARRTLL